jgi:hypothetical protein
MFVHDDDVSQFTLFDLGHGGLLLTVTMLHDVVQCG